VRTANPPEGLVPPGGGLYFGGAGGWRYGIVSYTTVCKFMILFEL